MKLRIQDNSLRLRVTRKEVAQLCETGRILSALELVPGQPLFYTLESSGHIASVTATFHERNVHVSLPANMVAEWAASDRVGIEGKSQSGARLLVEKDYQCLHGRAERDPEAYPHPLRS
jgi:hypothetical protein